MEIPSGGMDRPGGTSSKEISLREEVSDETLGSVGRSVC